MNVPSWLLKIVMAFLTDLELILRYKGKCSGKNSLPGGIPQGMRLGMFLFLILINFAGFDSCELEKNVGTVITQPLNKRKPISQSHMKYIDDLSFVHSLELKKVLTENPSINIPRPVSYHERTGHHLPDSENIIQKQFSKLKDFADRNEMKINHDKSKVMLFNTLS